MKKKLLIFSSFQFGYLTDTLKYCQYSKDFFDISYLCWDYNKPKVSVPGIHVRYIKRDRSLIIRNLRLLTAFYSEVNTGNHLIFANYTPGISLVRLLNFNRRILVDVRTLSVNPRRVVRLFSDLILKLELFFFSDISVISKEVAKKLNLKNYRVIPLGGESFCSATKSFERLHLLYVGTLQGRRVLDCVKGFHLYINTLTPFKRANCFFTIIGDSPDGELEEINQYVKSYGLENFVKTEGYIENQQLIPFFEKANVGVSYIPLTSYFDGQPPTKTFEYLLSGLPVIATNTKANNNIVNMNSGILVDDTIESFKQGIEQLANRRDIFQSNKIRIYYAANLWETIVKDILNPMLLSLQGRKENKATTN
jgi:glycosyltransferase involved in cell wall biosynthesis